MSFGFSVGDFIAVGELAERLYKEIYLVARHASQELLALQSEVATLNMSINLLTAEIKDKNSTLARSGEQRVNTVNGVLAETKKTLLELEKFSQSFGLCQRKAGAFEKVKSVLNKTKFAMDLPKVDALRARLQYQNGTLNLLFTSAGNSSLQRIETMDRKMNDDIGNLTKMMAQLTHQPLDDSTLTYNSPLTEKFLSEAEKGGRRWFSYGFDEWLRAGQWWLMSSQGRLEPETPEDLVIPVQPFVNLLKASSILLDILPRHPSIRLWDPTKEYLQFQLLANMLRDELETIEFKRLQKPELKDLQNAELGIWTEVVTTVQLTPDLHGQGVNLWQNADEETLWQGFGTFTYDPDVKPEDCMILVLVSKKIEKARIVAQNQRGGELASLRIDFDLLCAENLPEPELGHLRRIKTVDKSQLFASFQHSYSPDCRKPLGDGLRTIRLAYTEFSFSSIRDLADLSCVLRGIIFCQNIEGIRRDHAFLHAIILLFTIAYGDGLNVRKSVNLLCKRRCLEFYDDHESPILHIAKIVAEEFFRKNDLVTANNLPILFECSPPILNCPSMEPNKDVAKKQSLFDWAYGIFAAPIALGLPFSSFQSMSFSHDLDMRRSNLGSGSNNNADDSLLVSVTIAELAVISGNVMLIRHLDFEHVHLNVYRDAWRWRHRASRLYEWIGSIHFRNHFPVSISLLHYAAVYCPAPVLQLLIDAGADVFIKDLPLDDRSCTPLDCAVGMLKFDVARLLIPYYPVLDVLKEQVRLGRRGWYGYFTNLENPEESYIRIMGLLLENAIDRHVDVSINDGRLGRFKEESGNELCALAIERGNVPVAKYLIESGLAEVNELECSRQPALRYAIQLRDLEWFEYILGKSSPSFVGSSLEPGPDGRTLLHDLAEYANDATKDLLSLLLLKCESLPDLNTPSALLSPLEEALRFRNYTFARALVAAGCKVDGRARLARFRGYSGARHDVLLGLRHIRDRQKSGHLYTSLDSGQGWILYDPLWDDSDLDGMDEVAINNYFNASDYDERRSEHLLALAAAKLYPSNNPEIQSLSLSASASHD